MTDIHFLCPFVVLGTRTFCHNGMPYLNPLARPSMDDEASFNSVCHAWCYTAQQCRRLYPVVGIMNYDEGDYCRVFRVDFQ